MVVNIQQNIPYYVYILCLLFVLTTTYRDRYSSKRIVGGQNANRNEFPFMTSICLITSKSIFHSSIIQNCLHVCGASIISESWLLTAAHCFDLSTTDSDKPRRFKAVAGLQIARQETSDVQIRSVSQTIKHPKYNETVTKVENDIALLKVTKPFSYTNAVKNIYLPTSRHTNFTGQTLTVGWGLDFNPRPYTVEQLRYFSAPIISLEECRRAVRKTIIKIDDKHICTLPPANQSICRGDAGGPLIHKESNQIAGVISFTIGTCEMFAKHQTPNVYTSVVHYLKFIRRHTKI